MLQISMKKWDQIYFNGAKFRRKKFGTTNLKITPKFIEKMTPYSIKKKLKDLK